MTETKQKIQLVEGMFSPVEAADVLFSLIADKIKFHNIQMLNIQQGFNGDISHSEQRIKELKNAKNLAKDLIIKARDEGYELQIDSSIKIKLKKINHK